MEIEPHSRYLAQSLARSMLGGLRNFVPVILVLLGVGREGEGQGGPSRLPTHSEKWPCHQSPAWPGGEPRGTVGAWGGELTAGMDPSSPETGKKEPGLLGMCGTAQPPSDPPARGGGDRVSCCTRTGSICPYFQVPPAPAPLPQGPVGRIHEPRPGAVPSPPRRCPG